MHEPERGLGYLGDIDTARRASCCVSLLFISTEPSRHVLAFLPLFHPSHNVVTGPLGWNQLVVHVAFRVSLGLVDCRDAV